MAAIEPLAIDHVVLRVEDLERARAWYAAVFGCQVERMLPTVGLAQLRVGSTMIDLIKIKDLDAHKRALASGLQQRNMDHFCVNLAKFDEAEIRGYLTAQGIESGEIMRRYGAMGHGPSMYITDPDGNMVELKGPPDLDQTEQHPDAAPVAKRTEPVA